MVRLKSRTQSPVNGFQFIDAAISPDSIQTWDFEGLVAQVQARRAANPRFNLTTDTNAIRAEVDEQNALRMLSIRGADSYIVAEGVGGPAPNRSAPQRRAWAGVAGAVGNLASGATVLLDWLGEGAAPVAAELANQRAAICAKCPQNKPGDWTSWFTTPAAELIRQQLSLRSDLSLTTPDDGKLVVCSACGCPLKLKVHVPLKHVTEKLVSATKANLDGKCWILAETSAIK